MPIPQESIDRMMVKCGRRCCICRRFRPTKLQIHHIVERANGGSDDDDNLIVTCFSCHSDVHTKVPFARRFSAEELKGHREGLIALVAAGTLPICDTDDTDQVMAVVANRLRNSSSRSPQLLPEAVQVLLKAALTDGGMQGYVHPVRHDGGFSLLAAGIELEAGDRRSQSRYKAAFDQLIETGLIERLPGVNYCEVTHDGYLVADEITATTATEGQGEVKA